MNSQADVGAHVQNLETYLLKPEVRASRTKLNELLSDDFIEFGASGRVWNKKDIIASLIVELGNEDIVIEADTFRAQQITSDTVLLTYKCYRKNNDGEVLRTTLRSSIWRLVNEGWQLHFHQGTIVEKS